MHTPEEIILYTIRAQPLKVIARTFEDSASIKPRGQTYLLIIVFRGIVPPRWTGKRFGFEIDDLMSNELSLGWARFGHGFWFRQRLFECKTRSGFRQG